MLVWEAKAIVWYSCGRRQGVFKSGSSPILDKLVKKPITHSLQRRVFQENKEICPRSPAGQGQVFLVLLSLKSLELGLKMLTVRPPVLF